VRKISCSHNPVHYHIRVDIRTAL